MTYIFNKLLTLSACLSIVAVALSGCSSKNSKLTTESELYQAVAAQLERNQWEPAIKNLQTLEENFPFGTYAEQAQLELIYAQYNSGEPDAAIATANRFIRLHPQHRNVDYAYYMLGMSSFTKDKGIFERIASMDVSQRDPGAARESLANFTQLLNRFPDSPYAADAKKRMLYLRNLLARYEIHVANYYLKRGAYIAAIGRGRHVVENYPQTPAIPDALAVMVQGYRLMSMQESAEEILAILKLNYPNYPALDEKNGFNDDYMRNNGRSPWLAYLTLGLFSKDEITGFDTRELYDPQFVQLDDSVEKP
jgi:outer membrane protein assembly factor BamD